MKLFCRGDVDGFCAIALDNMVQLLLIPPMLVGVLGFRPELVYGHVLPGVAISYLVGNVFYAWQAHRLARKENRTDVCAIPFGLNTPTMIAYIYLVMAPAKQIAIAHGAADPDLVAWRVGLVACVGSGMIEFFGAFVAGRIRAITPRAALLASLSGAGVAFLTMNFLFSTFAHPIVGLVTLGLVLLFYFGELKPRGGVPPALVVLAVGAALAWATGLAPGGRLTLGDIGWRLPVPAVADVLGGFAGGQILPYLSVILPMGLLNLLASLQCIESAAAAGDSYSPRSSLMVNGACTFAAACFGPPFALRPAQPARLAPMHRVRRRRRRLLFAPLVAHGQRGLHLRGGLLRVPVPDVPLHRPSSVEADGGARGLLDRERDLRHVRLPDGRHVPDRLGRPGRLRAGDHHMDRVHHHDPGLRDGAPAPLAGGHHGHGSRHPGVDHVLHDERGAHRRRWLRVGPGIRLKAPLVVPRRRDLYRGRVCDRAGHFLQRADSLHDHRPRDRPEARHGGHLVAGGVGPQPARFPPFLAFRAQRCGRLDAPRRLAGRGAPDLGVAFPGIPVRHRLCMPCRGASPSEGVHGPRRVAAAQVGTDSRVPARFRPIPVFFPRATDQVCPESVPGEHVP